MFFETSSTLITFVYLGKYLEHYARGKTSDALAKLMDLQAPTALLLIEMSDGTIREEEVCACVSSNTVCPCVL